METVINAPQMMTTEFYFITHQYSNNQDRSCHTYQYGNTEVPDYTYFMSFVKEHVAKTHGWPLDKTVMVDIWFLTKHINN